MLGPDCFTTHFERGDGAALDGLYHSQCALSDARIAQLHYHDCLELGLCECGSGVCRIGDQAQPFAAGDVQLIFPYQRHLSRADEGTRCVWRFVSVLPIRMLLKAGLFKAGPAARLYAADGRLCGIVKEALYPQIARCIRLLVQEVIAPDAVSGDMLGLRLLELSLLLERSRTASDPQAPLAREAALFRILPALRLLETGCEETGQALRVSDLAAACHLCAGYFREQFILCTGLHPKQAILRRRLAQAELLLASTQLAIPEICRRTGFADASAFGRSFRACYGSSPAAYRRSL